MGSHLWVFKLTACVFILCSICFNILSLLRILEDCRSMQHDAVELVPMMASQRTTNAQSTTILWGIFSVDNDAERLRRKRIRETYLSFYERREDNPICALNDHGTIRARHCRLYYTFVLAGNPTGPTERLDDDNEPMVLPNTNSNETDLIFLNIRENMEDGKSQTWLSYASRLAQEKKIDYIAKCDSDTLLFVPDFFSYLDQSLPPSPFNKRIYSGYPVDQMECGGPDLVHCRGVKKLYMAGELYVLSPDLAAYVTSNQVNRTALGVGFEDINIGNFVHSHPLPIHDIAIGNKFWMHNRRIKIDAKWMLNWNKMMKQWKSSGLL